MAVNRRRGEIEAEFDGRPYRLVLTLGALAELEDAFKADDLARLVERFSTGRLSAHDMIRIIGVALRAGGSAVTDDDVAVMTADGGATGFARVVAELLTATFGETGS